jgi:hypothetical protein
MLSNCRHTGVRVLGGLFCGVLAGIEAQGLSSRLWAASCSIPFADADGDSDVDQSDFAVLQRCFSTPPAGVDSACACFDRNSDGAVDAVDAELFEACVSGPLIAADPTCERWPSGIISDEFNSYNVNPAHWTVLDPRGDCAVSVVGVNSGDSRLVINVPAGLSHTVWTDGITAPHLLQAVNDTDFEVEIRFGSVPTSMYQIQGLLVWQDEDTYLWFQFYAYGGAARFFAAVADNGNYASMKDAPVAVSMTSHLRVTRSGDWWTARASADGTDWTIVAQFTQAIQVSQLGPFVGNEPSTGSAPAFVGIIKYFRNTTAAFVPAEDSDVQDTYPPSLFAIEAAPDGDGGIVRWSTDEPATSQLDYGLTTDYELGSVVDPALVANHYLRVAGLVPGSTYHAVVRSVDAAGNGSVSADVPIVAGADAGGPSIDVWYGAEQGFGAWGIPQPAVNIVGNVSDPDGVASLTGSLNHGAALALRQGPNTRRLAQAGDFNADLLYDDLDAGANQLLLRAVDGLGNVSLTLVTVNRTADNVCPLPHTINWGQVATINSVAQVVDGLWMLEADGVRPAVMAYDRLIVVGDLTWQDYEVTVPITVHALNPGGYAAPSFGPGVGILCRWPGHSNDGSQPWQGIYPLGGIGLYRWTTTGSFFQIYGNNGVILATAPQADVLEIGVSYLFKVRVQTAGSVVTYRLKVWPVTDTEPTSWKLTGNQSVAKDPGNGSVVLLAHHVDATFGDVVIVPGPFP